jgi:hypothetical protein
MSKLITLNQLDDINVIEDILNDEIIIYEDVQASKIWVNWNGIDFIIRAKSLSNDPINLIDMTMQNYYNPAINFFNKLDDRVKSLLNKKWNFCFEYFPDEQPANIEYNFVPKNNLVLTYINKNNNKYDFNIDEIFEYARLLDVESLPIIFKGTLTEPMKEAIKYFLNTSEIDLEYVFGEKSFAYFFYKVLNPLSTNSFLMKDDSFQKNIEKLIIKTNSDDISFELLNPLYKKLENDNNTDFIEIYTLILLNFLNFCQSVNLSDFKIKGNTREEAYIYLVCKLYNTYLIDVKEDLINFDFIIPEFFNKDKFKINTELINNKLTKEYIKEDSKLEYVFKVILGSFNKKKKNPIGIFTENTVKLFNNFVDYIQHCIDIYLKRAHEAELNKSGLLDFSDFLDINYSVDGDGEVYPDIYNEFDREKTNKKKKMGKFTKFTK